jgi:serine/threonine-protein kinase
MIGTVVGSYKITEKIGEGGMGAVFRGVDVMLEREVAIKMLRPELSRQSNIVERFRSEAVTLAKLNHPYIATLYAFLRHGEDYFMVMEYVRGETLDNVIKKFGAMSVEQAVALFCQALEGIEHAHRLGIIHRDIKPANMMLTDSGSIKVMDFGIARVLGTDRLTRTGHLIGTIEYMSPEQVRGEETDARSDVYSLGILLYELLTGRVPFSATSDYDLMRCQIEQAPTPPRAFASHIPIAVEQAIMRSLAKRAEARFQSAGEFRGALLPTARAVTKPLEEGAHYRAPVTHVNAPFTNPVSRDVTQVASPTGGGVIKETRLAPGEIKETRLGTGHASPQPGAVSGQAQPAPASASLLARFNWKHYSAAGLLLLAIIAVPVALVVGSGDGPAPAEQPSRATQPSPQPVPPAPGAESSAPAPVSPSYGQPSPGAPAEQTAAPPVPVPEESTPRSASKPRARGAGSQPVATAPTTASKPEPATPKAEPPKTTPPKKEEPAKKEEQKKEKKPWWKKIPDVIKGKPKN